MESGAHVLKTSSFLLVLVLLLGLFYTRSLPGTGGLCLCDSRGLRAPKPNAATGQWPSLEGASSVCQVLTEKEELDLERADFF